MESEMFGLLLLQSNTITKLDTLALEWHAKQLSDSRFAIRVYEELVSFQVAESKMGNKIQKVA